jgi:hypothetical protein
MSGDYVSIAARRNDAVQQSGHLASPISFAVPR